MAATLPTSSPRPIPPNTNQPIPASRQVAYKVNLAEEEDAADYKPGGYHPVHIMDTFSEGRYLILRKMGWGHFSTVWLAKDNQLNQHVALKIMKSSRRYTETALDEIKLLRTVQTSNPTHPGYAHVVSFLDSFQHSGLHGQPHVCMTFEPLGENLLSLTQRCVKENKLLATTMVKRKHRSSSISSTSRPITPQPTIDLAVPPAIVKSIAKQVLLGLAYLHEECKLIHTDLKPENILISLPDVEEVVRMELLAIPTSESIKCSTRTMIGVPAGYNRTKSPSSLHNNQVYIFSSQPLSSPSRTPASSLACSLQNSPMERLGMRMSALNVRGVSGSGTVVTAATATATKSVVDKKRMGSAFALPSSSLASSTNTASSAQGDDSPPARSPSSSNNTTPVTPVSDFISPSAIAYNLASPMGSYKITEGIPSSLGSMDVVVVPRITKDPSKSTSALKRELSNEGTVLAVDSKKESAHTSQATINGSSRTREMTPIVLSNGHLTTSDSTPTNGGATPNNNVPLTPIMPSGPSLLSRTAPKQPVPLPEESVSQPLISEADLQETFFAEQRKQPPQPPLPPSPPPLHVKIADMGNATPIHKKFTNDIQTRQYRSPEAILGMYEWDEKVDIFSVACLVFELLTGEYLFNPKGTARWTKDDDHIAQITELMGDGFSPAMKSQGKYSREIFKSNGSLRNIKNLNLWPLASVMMEKYDYSKAEAESFASFMEPMLTVDPKERASASSLVDHEWLRS